MKLVPVTQEREGQENKCRGLKDFCEGQIGALERCSQSSILRDGEEQEAHRPRGWGRGRDVMSAPSWENSSVTTGRKGVPVGRRGSWSRGPGWEGLQLSS